MGYISQLVQTQNTYLQQQANNQAFIGLPPGAAYASYFPTWEVTAPQYIQPTAYTLAQLGYRTNEVAYACIDLWMKTISEAPIKVYEKDSGEVVENHDLTKFMERPCPDISQSDFWQAVIMYLKIAGIMAWEKDYSNGGSLINLWPMMPQFCSYMRGQGRLLATIRYQPYTGLPYLDIDRSRCVVFSYVDPLYYGLKPFSPTMVLKDVIDVDNKMTNMVSNFIQNGAFVSGLLKTEQLIDEQDAKFARDRWQEAHGGYQNAGQIAIVGKGLEFQASGATFQQMVFPEVDARSEIRICMTYGVKPILLSAKAGLDRSTFSNYEEARKAWYEENVTAEWRFLEERINRDLLPEFDDDPNHIALFDRTTIKALQEDRDKAWKRSDDAYKARVITRDEARKEKGLDPMKDPLLGSELYMTVMEQQSLSMEDNLDTPNAAKEDSEVMTKGPGLIAVRDKKTTAEKEEEKAFRRFAMKRIEENKQHMIGMFEFKYIDQNRQRQLLNEFGVPDADAKLVADMLAEYIKSSNIMPVYQQQPQSINITANIEQSKPPSVEVNMPEVNINQDGQVIKSIEFPTPLVNVNVEPTPIQNNIENNVEFEAPKIKRTIQKVKYDKNSGDIDATVTQYEYEEKEDKEEKE